MRRFNHVVLHVGPEAMLRAEDGRQAHSGGFREPIDDVPEGVADRRMIADNADAGAAEARRRKQDVGAETNGPCRGGWHASHYPVMGCAMLIEESMEGSGT